MGVNNDLFVLLALSALLAALIVAATVACACCGGGGASGKGKGKFRRIATDDAEEGAPCLAPPPDAAVRTAREHGRSALMSAARMADSATADPRLAQPGVRAMDPREREALRVANSRGRRARR